MTRLAVAIPTRNRADLAQMAVRSVLCAGRADVSLVVSDNSTDADQVEQLRSFCEGLPEVTYTRPPEPLPMDAHWEWLRRFAQRETAPTHLTFLTDRMVFPTGALDAIAAVVADRPDRVVSYLHDTVDDGGRPVALLQSQWTGRLLELDARGLLRLASRGEFGKYMPRMLNSVAPVAVLERIEARYGDVFRSVAPDWCFTYRCLATCDAILCLDRACIVEHGMLRSAGITFTTGRPNEAAVRFQRELEVPRFGATPEPRFETVANAIWQEYFSIREQTGDDRFPPVDHDAYLAANAASVARLEDPDWGARMQELLRRHGWTRADAARHAAREAATMAGYFARHPSAVARTLKRQLWDRPPGSALGSLLARAGISAPASEGLAFESTAAAIAHAGTHPRPPRPYAFHVHRLERAGALRSSAEPPRG